MTRRAHKKNSYGPSVLGKSPARKRREEAGRRRQEKRWAAQSGVVVVRYVCPACGGAHARSDCPTADA